MLMRTRRTCARVFFNLCLFAPGLIYPTWLVQAQVISARVGYVLRTEGTTWIRRHGETELNPLHQSVGLSDGDVVITGNDGRMELSLTFGSNLQVGPLSEVWIYAIEEHQIHFDILRGEVSATVAELSKRVTLVLDTPPAELQIVKRGSYTVRVAADNATDAYVGAGELRFADTGGKLIILHTHKHVHFAAPPRR